MHIFLDKFHQGEKYTAQIASHQSELRREKTIIDQKYLSITSLQTDYLNLESSSGCGKHISRGNLFQKKALFVGVLTVLQKNVSKVSERIRKNLL